MSKYNIGDKVFHVDVYQNAYEPEFRVTIEEKVVLEPGFHNALIDKYDFYEQTDNPHISKVHDDFLFENLAQAIDYAKYRLDKVKHEGMENG